MWLISILALSTSPVWAASLPLPSNGGSDLSGTEYVATGKIEGDYTFTADTVDLLSNFEIDNKINIHSRGSLTFKPDGSSIGIVTNQLSTIATFHADKNLEIDTKGATGGWGPNVSPGKLTFEAGETLSGDTSGKAFKVHSWGELTFKGKNIQLSDSSDGKKVKENLSVTAISVHRDSVVNITADENLTIEGGIRTGSGGNNKVNVKVGGNIDIGNNLYNSGSVTIESTDQASENSEWTFSNLISSMDKATDLGMNLKSDKVKVITVTNGVYIAMSYVNSPIKALTVNSSNADFVINGQAYYYPPFDPSTINNQKPTQYNYGFISERGSISEVNARSITINKGLRAFYRDAIVNLNATDDLVIHKTKGANDQVVVGPTVRVEDFAQVSFKGKNVNITANEGFNTIEIIQTRPIFSSYASTLKVSADGAFNIEGDTLVESIGTLDITSPETVLTGGALSVVNYSNVTFAKVNGANPKLTIQNLRGAEGKTATADDPNEALFIDNSQLDWSGVDTKLVVSEDPTYSPSMSPALHLENEATLTLDEAPLRVVGDMVMNASSALTIGAKTKVRQVGDILLANEATADITLNAESTWEGRADDWLDVGSPSSLPHSETLKTVAGEALEVEKPGTLSLTMAGGTWTARGQSTLSALTFDKGVVDMTKDVASSVSVGKLSGTGGTVKMALHSDPTKSDMLYVKDASETSPVKVEVALADGADVTAMKGLRFASTAGYTGDDLFEVTSKDQGFNDMAYTLAHEAYDQANSENAHYNAGDGKPGTEWADSVFGEAGTNWYLDKVIVTPSKPAKVIMATARRNYWQAVDMDRLNKRLGDRRLAGDEDHGLWVRMRHDRLGTNAGVGDFRSRDWTYQVGYDYSWKRDGGQQLFGFALDYKDADTHYRSVNGTGSSDRVGLTAYTTWLGNTGWYYDAVARWGRLSNDFTLFNSRGERITADYHNSVWSLSLEGGKKLTHEATRIYFEPQAQVQFLTMSDADYTTSQETRVHQDRLNSVITRLGFRLGRDFGAQERSTVYVKADWMREWRGRETIRAFDITTPDNGSEVTFKNRGNWFDVGLGVQSPITDKLYGFVDTEYRFGNDLQKSWQFNAGVRLLF